jgi:quercetin dioxygenase-like cupin family protein
MNQPARITWIAATLALSATGWPLAVSGGGGDALSRSDAVVKDLMTRDLTGSGSQEIRLMTVEYLAGGASLPHRHHAQVFVYVLDGAVRMQVEGAAPVTLGPGETFYEGPDDIHVLSANASQTKPARILVFMIKDKASPVAIPVTARKPS